MATEVEREGTWGELGVGSVMRDREGARWEVVAAAVPAQYDYGRSNWLRIRGADGAEHAIEPRHVLKKVIILEAPGAPPVEPSWPDGAREAALLVEALGAIEIGTQDKRTGEIWCPADSFSAEEALLHLQVAHGMDVTGIDTTEKRATIHGQAHNINSQLGKAGFPHRHIPEDPSFIK